LYAYHVFDSQVTGITPYDSLYMIEAKTESLAAKAELRLMFQSLLTDRFKLAFHREKREITVHSLVVDKKGPKIKALRPGEKSAESPGLSKGKPPLPEGRIFSLADHGQTILAGRRVTLAQLCESMSYTLGTLVEDQTGLPGEFDIALTFVRDSARPTKGQIDGPSIFAATVEQLGLRLTSRKSLGEVLVVDHLEGPSEN
jgi:uncharacterized protein (TIGR03435 family)